MSADIIDPTSRSHIRTVPWGTELGPKPKPKPKARRHTDDHVVAVQLAHQHSLVHQMQVQAAETIAAQQAALRCATETE